jgi:hypothetical protein
VRGYRLTTKGLLLEAMMQKGGGSFSHHRVPDGYCNQEITWAEIDRLDAAGFNRLLDDLLLCAREAEPEGKDGSAENVVAMRPKKK